MALLDQFTPEEQQLLQIIQDEILWAKVELKWEPRWYQEKILRESTRRTVLRCGRRVGKTDTACVRILYRAFTKPGRALDESYIVLIVTPFESQIDAIFRRLRELINRSTLLKASVVGDTKNPQEIRLANGSRIIGFTAGSRSGNGASNIRGQRADFIYLDECDYLADEDINTVLAIALEDPDRIEILASSTPSGRRSHFYRWCTNKELGWKEFHFPSWVNPNWNEETEREFRENLSELAWIHEIEAEFGEEQAGVFQKKHLDASYELAKQLGYTHYPTEPYPKQGVRALGVDWDVAQATPTLVGVEWWPEWKRFRVFLREQLPKTEFTLDYAVNRIIHLHMLWNFDYIVCDRGMGEFQVETLRKYGVEHPETGLAERVIGYQLGEKIEVRDPYTKQPEKKPLKPFMVNCTVRLLERGLLVLCPEDTQMRKQLQEYRIVRVGQNGNPIFTDENEHMVDALNLAVLQISLKHDDLFKVSYTTAVRHLPPKQDAGIRDTLQPAQPQSYRFNSGSNTAMIVAVPRRQSRSVGRFRTII